MRYRPASEADLPRLAELNQQLYEAEGNRSRFTLDALEARLRKWLQGEYQCVVFEQDQTLVAYALYRLHAEGVFLRHLCVDRQHRRRGIGREAVALLLSEVWPPQVRVTLQVLASNPSGYAFWRALGFSEYATVLEMLREQASAHSGSEA